MIKFRAWDLINNRFRKIKRLIVSHGEVIGVQYSDDKDIMSIDSVILQRYTGLKDKNGKEIYEGDIFVVRDPHDGDEDIWMHHLQEPIPQLVEWDEKKCRFRFGSSTRILYNPYHFEVIGNIFENPDLLEERKKSIYG